MNGRLYIAAKAPRPGLAKTRLGLEIGNRAAISLYRAFLRDIAVRFATAPFPVGWYITPPSSWPEIASVVGHGWPPEMVLGQPPGDWSRRQRDLFKDQDPCHDHPVILIASDSPQITIPMVLEGFRVLDTHDVVLGPVTDGGYWLIGMRTALDIFDGIQMSTATVVDQILVRAQELGASLGYAASTFDIDTRDDLPPLIQAAQQRDDLPATRNALASLGLLSAGTTYLNHADGQREPLVAASASNWSTPDDR